MKKVVLGSAVMVCGVILWCTNHITLQVFGAIPQTTIVSEEILGSGYVIITLVGLAVSSCIQKDN